MNLAMFIIFSLTVCAVMSLYFLPAIIAYLKHRRDILSIFVLNLLLGWTLIGWVIGLVWSLMPEKEEVFYELPTKKYIKRQR